jgi:hypothetical protein
VPEDPGAKSERFSGALSSLDLSQRACDFSGDLDRVKERLSWNLFDPQLPPREEDVDLVDERSCRGLSDLGVREDPDAKSERFSGALSPLDLSQMVCDFSGDLDLVEERLYGDLFGLQLSPWGGDLDLVDDRRGSEPML